MDKKDFQMEKKVLTHIKSGNYVIIKGRPCRITDTKLSKTGKHGCMKVRLFATDCITGKNDGHLGPGDSSLIVFKIIRSELQVLNTNDEPHTISFQCLQENNEETVIDVNKNIDNTMDNYIKIKQLLENTEKSVLVNIITVPIKSSTNDDIDLDDVSFEHMIDSFKEQTD